MSTEDVLQVQVVTPHPKARWTMRHGTMHLTLADGDWGITVCGKPSNGYVYGRDPREGSACEDCVGYVDPLGRALATVEVPRHA